MGIDRLSVSFTNATSTDGHIVAFYRDLVEDILPPTINIPPEWWEVEDRPVVYSATESQSLIKLVPEYTAIPSLTTANKINWLLLAYLACLQFVHPLLAVLCLSPAASYNLLVAQAAALRWEGQTEPLPKYIQDSLIPSFPYTTDLPPLDLADHFIVYRKRLLLQMVPARTPLSTSGVTTIIMQAPNGSNKRQRRRKMSHHHWGYNITCSARCATSKHLPTSPIS